MKRGTELGIAPIKTEARRGNDDLKKLHFKLNELMYHYAKRYISPMVAEKISENLIKIGVEFKEFTGTEAAKKAAELQEKIRPVIINLRNYIAAFRWSQEDLPQIQASINYFVRETVKLKKAGMLEEKSLEVLKDIKEIWKGMVEPSGLEKQLNLKSFNDFKDELLEGII